ncbi:MAG: hypothetical protein ABIP89_06495 [Polyangiaceae bacterium]
MNRKRMLVGGALLAFLALAASGLFLWERRTPPQKIAPVHQAPRLELHVPHAGGSIVLDGDVDDPGWRKNTARTKGFVNADGLPARPYSDARLAWADGHLYLALYAADEDIRTTDSFHLELSAGNWRRTIDVTPLGVLTDGQRVNGTELPWKSGAHVSHELDGTPDDDQGDDEEWVLEMAIPFESVELEGKRGEEIGFSVHRCDKPKLSAPSCGSWGEGEPHGVLILD